jgi:siroheme decarboxylase
MISTDKEKALFDSLSKGLPICEFPYLELSKQLGLEEVEVLNFISNSLECGKIKRIGMVVNHHKLGYTANAMVVWDVPDGKVDSVGETLGNQDKVTLCYQRPRRLPDWSYNLFTMIHGKNKQQVLDQIDEIVSSNQLQSLARDVLFSSRKFKQTGARYG